MAKPKILKAVEALKEARPACPTVERLADEASVLATKVAGASVSDLVAASSTGAKLRGYTSAERKEMPVQTLMAEYFPDAIAAVARHAKKANVKHNGPDAPMSWARGKSTDHLNCAGRHLMTPDAIDPDTGEIELVGASWRCLAALQLREEARLKAAGIKPLSGCNCPTTGIKMNCPVHGTTL